MSQTLFRYGTPEPPVCRCGRPGTTRCASCLKADDMTREIKRRLTERRLRRQTFGPAPEGTDEFRGFREGVPCSGTGDATATGQQGVNESKED